MKKVNKLTRKYFCSIYTDMARMRRNDPIQFSVLFNEWVRLRSRQLTHCLPL